MHAVLEAHYEVDYCVRLLFANGQTKWIDLGPHLTGEIFEPLKAMELFKTFQVHPELKTIVWENGADFAPDFLYQHGESQKTLKATT